MSAQLAFAFLAGTVASANPCGVGLLPAYIGRLLEAEKAHRGGTQAVGRALAVGAMTTVGFLVVFGAVGSGISLGARWLIDAMAWVGLVVGAVLIVLGVAVLCGRHVGVRAPLPGGPARPRGLRSAVLFGMGYGACSLSCTLPIFLMVVGTSVTVGVLAAPLSFVAYALGMGWVLTSVAVAVALPGRAPSRVRRLVLSCVRPVSGVLLLLAGAYVVYYWTYALLEPVPGSAWAQPIAFMDQLSSTLRAWLVGRSGRILTVTLVSVLVALAVGMALWRMGGRPARAKTRPPAGAGR